MAEDVVNEIRRRREVDVLGAADHAGHREDAARHQPDVGRARNVASHRYDPPAGALEAFVELFHAGDPVRQRETTTAFDVAGVDPAGVLADQVVIAPKHLAPDRVGLFGVRFVAFRGYEVRQFVGDFGTSRQGKPPCPEPEGTWWKLEIPGMGNLTGGGAASETRDWSEAF
jgi:hypothetical protein